jgi:hypothetical protein
MLNAVQGDAEGATAMLSTEVGYRESTVKASHPVILGP